MAQPPHALDPWRAPCISSGYPPPPRSTFHIGHHREDRVRADVFLCTLALYLEWHLRQAWRELTFGDEQRPEPPDPVAKAARSPAADRMAATKTTSGGHVAHTVRDLLTELATLTRNTIRVADSRATFTGATMFRF